MIPKRLNDNAYELYVFAREANEARFPAFTWKTTALDMMGLPVGTRPTHAQISAQPHAWSTLWGALTQRFEPMCSVRWAEYREQEEERIHNALTYLGGDVKTISERLALMGVMGVTTEHCDCPLSHYFTGIHGAWFVDITRSSSVVDFAVCANSNAVNMFVRDFDNDRIPELTPFALCDASA